MEHQDRYDEAMFEYSMGNYENALAKLKALLAEAPAHFEAQLALAMCYSRLGDYQAALAEGHKAEALNPKDPLVHTNLSLFYIKAGDKAKAEHHAAQARMASWKDTLSAAGAAPPPEAGTQKRPPPPPPPAGPKLT